MTASLRHGLTAIVACTFVVAASGQDWNAADRATRRLRPSAFSELPQKIRMELERRGCTIPQTSGATKPENVIQGRFTSATQMDWAVLCSIRRSSTILVFRGGSTVNVAALDSAPDIGYLQGGNGANAVVDVHSQPLPSSSALGGEAIEFSRLIGKADATFIKEHYRAYGGPKPPPIDHEGIDDIFVEKASSVRYWYRGRWLKLTGSD